MKSKILLLSAVLMSSAAMAQNEQIHLFRNDKAFNSYKASDIESISFTDNDGSFVGMLITDKDSKGTTINISAIDSVVMSSTGLPEIHVNLTDYPDWTDLLKDQTHTKETEYSATLYMEGNGMYDDLPLQNVTFRGRGNSTWNLPKTPYRFKMSSKTSVCGMKKAKSFVLIANYIDCTLMRNAIALWVSQRLGMPFANHCVPVKMYFNNIYKGAYMLTEKIGIGSGSVDIDENTGILFELDSNYDEDFKYQFSWTSGSEEKYLPVMVKDPDFTEIAPELGTTATEYWDMWQTDFTKFANAVVSRPASQSLSDVLDMESAVNFFMVNGLCNNHEMQHPKSLFIHKDSINGIYKFGPVWDFDGAFTYDGSSYNGEQGSPTTVLVAQDCAAGGYSFLKCLFANAEFRTLFKARLEKFAEEDYPQLKNYMEEYAALIEPSAKENGLLWDDDTSIPEFKSVSSWEFRNNFNTLKSWLDTRVKYMLDHKNFGLYE